MGLVRYNSAPEHGAADGFVIMNEDTFVVDGNVSRGQEFFFFKHRRGKGDVVALPFIGLSASIDQGWGFTVDCCALAVGVEFFLVHGLGVEDLNLLESHEADAIVATVGEFVRLFIWYHKLDVDLAIAESLFAIDGSFAGNM